MNKNLLNELYFKAFRSGNPLYLFIGINILVFLTIGLITVAEFLFGFSNSTSDWISRQLSMPANLETLAYKPWTIITYMFLQRDVLHILFNLLWLYWMGMIFMDFLNKRQFTFTYLAGGIIGALFYLLAYNTLPAFTGLAQNSILLGSSASVMAVVVATATLVPDYTIRLLLFGTVRLKYLAIAYFVLDIISMSGGNPGGSIAHIGGAILGFFFIKQLNGGRDLSKILKKKSRLKVVQNKSSTRSETVQTDQETIDKILDKISKSGYDSLNKSEKEALFKASKK
jgi:membrane associated rhomboid family serine protease